VPIFVGRGAPFRNTPSPPKPIAGDECSNPHRGLILVGLLMIGGAIPGLIVGAVTACRVAGRVT
jgi:hypothetical protein